MICPFGVKTRDAAEGLIIFLLPIIALFSPQAMPAPLILLAGISFIKRPKAMAADMTQSHKVYYILFGFIAFCLLSLSWSITPNNSAQLAVKLFALTVSGILLSQLPCQYFSRRSALFLGHVVVCLVIIFNHFRNDSLQSPWYLAPSAKVFAQAGLFLSLSFWVCVYALIRSSLSLLGKTVFLVTIGLLTLMSLYHVHCDTPILGLILGALVGLVLSFVYGNLIKRTIQALIFLAFLLAPIICSYTFHPDSFEKYNTIIKDPSYLHRLTIWYETAKKIRERPLLGYGLNASRKLGSGATIDLVYKDGNDNFHTVKAEKMGLHPHNVALQLWLELGVIGAGLGALITAVLFGSAYDTQEKLKRLCLFGFFTSAVFAFWVNLGAFQSWWLSSILLLVYFFKNES